MRDRLLRSGAPVAGTVLALTLGIISVGGGQSIQPKLSGGHAGHHVMKEQTGQATGKHGEATPKGWRFALPPGSPQAGRTVFAEFECFKCHAIQGEKFPAPRADEGQVGPTLAGMGAMHPAEYFAEVIMNPNASVAWRIKHHKTERQTYLGADGKSKMPSYSETMTIQQLIDVVAYLKSLTSTSGHKH